MSTSQRLSFHQGELRHTANELHNPDCFLAMADTFSLETADRETLLHGHGEMSTTDFNMTPQKQPLVGDTEIAEQEVWEAIANYEPLLRQRLMARYADVWPDG